MKFYMFSLAASALLVLNMPASQAQESHRPSYHLGTDGSQITSRETSPSSEVAQSSIGQAGVRQTISNNQTNIEPTGRLNNRIANRVQNRIRNRIDRYYDPTANATSPFEVAAEKVTSAQKP